jgi:quercetin dioxygenase-like cupin family protein
MRVLGAEDLTIRNVDQFGSAGFAVSVLGRTHSVVAHLEPGGRIGRHPAPVDQALVVLSGVVTVCGEDGEAVEIAAGRMAVWAAGESHETGTANGAIAVILEADGLAASLA